MCVAPSREAQKPSALVPLSPFLLSLAQLSSSIRCQLGGSVSLSSQPTVKRQRLDENTNPMVLGTSAAAANSIDNRADDNGEDDDDVKILIDKDDDNDDDNDEAAVVIVNAHGSVNVGTPRPANATDSSGFGPFILLNLHDSVVADIKGQNRRKFLNKL